MGQEAQAPGNQAISDVSGLLRAWSGGHPKALDRLTPIVYGELHHLARRYMSGERAGHSLPNYRAGERGVLAAGRLQADAMAQNRAHFFAVSAQLMRRILV